MRLAPPWVLVAFATLTACARPMPVREQMPPVPARSEQVYLREQWLEVRHGLVLDMMRRHGVAMWVVVNEAFHDDPLTELVAPPRLYLGGRDLFVFIDAGEAGLRRVAVTGFAEENLRRFFESPEEPRPADEVLPELLEAHRPATIALPVAGPSVTRGLTKASYDWLAGILDGDAMARVVPATELIEEYVDTRIPEELEPYRRLVELTSELGRRAFSNEVITPGVTRVGDVRRWLLDRFWELRVEPWFQPDLRVQRRGRESPMSRGFLAVAPERLVIERGDLLHLDIGFVALGLATDWQKMAYVLRDGEDEAPEGLRRSLADTNRLQDVLSRAALPGRTAAEVYTETMTEMDRLGVEAQIYSHPLGPFGHGLGASIDFRSATPDDDDSRPSKRLRLGSYLAMELNTSAALPEWDGQEVWVMEEDPVHITDSGLELFVPRQEAFYLIR